MEKDYGNWVEKVVDGKNIKVNTSTGEVRVGHERIVYDGDVVLTPEAREAQRKYREHEAEREDRKARRRRISKNNGDHYFVPRLHRFPDLKPQTATRLIYLFTYADYSERGGQLLLTQKTKMAKKDLQEVLGLSDDAVNDFLVEVCPQYLLTDEKGCIFATSLAYQRGALRDGRTYHRFYDRWVQTLYRNVSTRKHRYLGYIFQLLPYISVEYNVLCYNPMEEDISKIEFMSLGEFCKQIGYDSSHTDRLLKAYRQMRFPVMDKDGMHTERFVSITYDGQNRHNAKVFVNPRILYSGAHPESVELLGAFSQD